MPIPTGAAAERPSLFQIWWLAARPWTLPASLTPIIIGTAVAIHEGRLHLPTAIVALIVALLLQIAANFANDAIDFRKGTDTEERVGPTRITAAGYVTYRQVMGATVLTLALALLFGLYLVMRGGWPFLLLGAAALICAVAYTGGPFPISYLGLGEVFVFLFFGLAAVTGTAYLQTRDLSAISLVSAIPAGCMSVGVLIVNNYRDYEGDRRAHKRTVAVRIGRAATRLEYMAMLALTLLTPFLFWALGWMSAWALLTVLAWPLFWQLVVQIRTLQGPALNRTLGQTGRTGSIFGLLFAIALVLS